MEDIEAARCIPDTEDDVAQRHKAGCHEREVRRVRRHSMEVAGDDGPSPPSSRWETLGVGT